MSGESLDFYEINGVADTSHIVVNMQIVHSSWSIFRLNIPLGCDETVRCICKLCMFVVTQGLQV